MPVPMLNKSQFWTYYSICTKPQFDKQMELSNPEFSFQIPQSQKEK